MSSGDFEQVRELAEQQGLQREDLPDFGSNVLVKRVVESEPGIIVCAAIARIEVMSHLYLDRSWSTPKLRFEAFKLLQAEVAREVREKGIEIMHAEVSSRAFRRRLKDLGWDTPARPQLVLGLR